MVVLRKWKDTGVIVSINYFKLVLGAAGTENLAWTENQEEPLFDSNLNSTTGSSFKKKKKKKKKNRNRQTSQAFWLFTITIFLQQVHSVHHCHRQLLIHAFHCVVVGLLYTYMYTVAGVLSFPHPSFGLLTYYVGSSNRGLGFIHCADFSATAWSFSSPAKGSGAAEWTKHSSAT